MLKHLADEMVSCTLVDAKTHFKIRLAIVHFLLGEKKDVSADSTHSNEEAYSSAKKWTRMEKYEVSSASCQPEGLTCRVTASCTPK